MAELALFSLCKAHMVHITINHERKHNYFKSRNISNHARQETTKYNCININILKNTFYVKARRLPIITYSQQTGKKIIKHPLEPSTKTHPLNNNPKLI